MVSTKAGSSASQKWPRKAGKAGGSCGSMAGETSHGQLQLMAGTSWLHHLSTADKAVKGWAGLPGKAWWDAVGLATL